MTSGGLKKKRRTRKPGASTSLSARPRRYAASRSKTRNRRGIRFDDTDVYKVSEGAAYTLSVHPDPKLEAYVDDLIAKIGAAREKDGYLYTTRRHRSVEAACLVESPAKVSARSEQP